jgi:processive 1,2-diacylglycerol beta-glucosyltransferase
MLNEKTNHPIAGYHPRVAILYEYGEDFRPHSSPFLRLIRPFSHPLLKAHIDTIFARDYYNEPVDVVIIDRLWRRDISLPLTYELVNKIRRQGAKIVYSLDDNYFDLPLNEISWPSREVLPVVEFLLHQADALLVTTPALKQSFRMYNPNIYLIANQLDERLLVYRQSTESIQIASKKRIVIGYMGTYTHDEDFLMVLPALKSIHQRFPGQIEIQVIGVVSKEETKKELEALPVRYIYPRPEEHEYPLFMLWFTGHVHWDIAISPLKDTTFNACKSDIKFLDYASIAAAGIFSQSPAYASTVLHQQNGWLVENTPTAWEQALETLLQDPAQRLKIAQNASIDLYSDRILAKRAVDWVELIKAIC